MVKSKIEFMKYVLWTLVTPVVISGVLSAQVPLITYTSLEDKKLDSIIVARVGTLAITAKEFLISYEFGPGFVRYYKNPKRTHLDFMINEKLVALDGYAQNVQETKQVNEVLTAVEQDLATEELYKDDIYRRVQVSNDEIENGVKKAKVHLNLKWLYSKAPQEMKAQKQLLDSGVPFDTLFQKQLNDSIQADARSMEVTKFRLEKDNEILSKIVDTLAQGKTSGVIQAPDGYYIVKVEEIWSNPITTEAEYTQLRYYTERTLRQHKADVLSDRYVDSTLKSRSPIIKRRTFNLLQGALGKKVLPQDKFEKWNLTRQVMTEAGPINVADIDRYRNEVLVQLRGGTVTLGEFLEWYRLRQYDFAFKISSPQSFFASLEGIVWRMVRDKLLTEEAYRRGLQLREVVRVERKRWEDKLSYMAMKYAKIDTIKLDDAQVRQYYEKYKHNYRDTTGAIKPFEDVKEDVQRDYFQFKQTEILLHYLVALKQKYKVEIYEDVLNALPVTDEKGEQPIDVILFKKGGTFPRRAIPTIDYDWRLWR